jgi:hypothetical protein
MPAMVVAAYIAATVLEVVGLGLAAFGFVRTWRENAIGRDYWQPYKDAWARVADGVAATARKILGRHPAHVVGAGATTTARATVTGRATVTWGPLPDPGNAQEFAAEVHERLNVLRLAIQNGQDALLDERKAWEAGDDAVRAALGTGSPSVLGLYDVSTRPTSCACVVADAPAWPGTRTSSGRRRPRNRGGSAERTIWFTTSRTIDTKGTLPTSPTIGASSVLSPA